MIKNNVSDASVKPPSSNTSNPLRNVVHIRLTVELCVDLEIGSDGMIYVAGYTEGPGLYTTKGAVDSKRADME
ncbi:MAG: hypothetical protein RRA35_12945, partial [Desulfomonilia bacterium]|nr:hypothetical protein [Desulfomonilia bacterium]